MDEPILPLFADPADHSAADRTRAIASILAAGLLRHLAAAEPAKLADSGGQKPPESLSNQLAVRGAQSVTVQAG